MPDVLKQKTIKTRKDHLCWGCNEYYPAGTKMLYMVVVDNGDFWSGYYCELCSETMSQAPVGEFDDGIGCGDLKEYRKEIYPYEQG